MDAKARAQAARERAKMYREGENRPDDRVSQDGARTMDEWTDIVGKRIKEAMRRGAFDNLPGRGKPVDTRGDSLVPEDQRMAFKLLKNNDLIPSWIGDRNLILREIEAVRAEIQSRGQAMQTTYNRTTDPVEAEALRQAWNRTIAGWEARVVNLNKRIVTQNLQQPADHLEIIQLRFEEELRRAGVSV